MSKQITAAELKGMIAEAVKEATGGLTPEEFKKQQDELKALREAAEKIQREHTAPLNQADAPQSAYLKRAEGEMKRDRLKGHGFRIARFVRAQAAGRLLEKDPIELANKDWKDKELADWLAASKALGTVSASAGASLLPDTFADEVIELLRAESVVRASGVRTIPMARDTFKVGRQSGAGTASYSPESTAVNASQLTTDGLDLRAKKLISVSPIANELLRGDYVAFDQLVRDDLAAIIGLAQDIKFIRGDGTQSSPKGVRNLVSTANVFAATQAGAAATLAEVTTDLFKMIRLVSQANVKLRSPIWWMEDRAKFFLASLRDGNGNLIFGAELMAGRLLGMPVLVSNQIPNNLGSGTNESEIYFVEATEAAIGDKTQLMIETFPNGTYVDSSGTMQSGVSRDETVVRGLAEHDFGMRHPLGASVLSTVKYGA